MAFPLNSAHLISHLRSSYLILFDNDNDIRSTLIANDDDPESSIYKDIFEKLTILTSPPITLISEDKFHELDKPVKSHSSKRRSRIRRRRSRLRDRKRPSIVEEHPEKESNDQITDEEDNNEISYANRRSKETENGGINNDKKLKNIINFNGTITDEESLPDNNITDEENEGTGTDGDLTEDNNDNSFKKNELKYSQTINPRKVKNNFIRLFQKDHHHTLDSDSSDDSVKTTKIESISQLIQEPQLSDQITDEEIDSDSTQKLPVNEHDRLNYGNNESIRRSGSGKQSKSNQNNDVVTLNSKTETGSIDSDEKSDFNGDITLDSKDSLDDDFSDDDDDYDDDYDYEYDDDDFDDDDVDNSSSDSAFTDIEADSMLDSLDDTFGASDPYNKQSSKYRKRKSRSNSFVLNSDKNDNSTFPNTVPSKVKLTSMTPSSSSSLNFKNGNSKRPVIKFEKVDTINKETEPKVSNLSSLLQYRNRSVNINPLNFYSFVKPSLDTTNAFKINVSVPPKRTPTLLDLEINTSISIADCIGYILLKLNDKEDLKLNNDLEYLDPNHWRLELVDEDGENYGSFGILDRSRLFSSYNNPKELAICRVDDIKEYRKNQVQSPLAIEFKQNLIAYRRKQLLASEFSGSNSNNSPGDIEGRSDNNNKNNVDHKVGGGDNDVNNDVGEDSKEYIQLTISLLNGRTVEIDFDSKFTVKEVLYDLCASQFNLNPSNYGLRLVIPAIKHHLSDGNNELLTLKNDSDLIDNPQNDKRLLNNNELIRNLESMIMELVPVKTGPVLSLLADGESNISPEIDNSISPVNVDLITPPKFQSDFSNSKIRKSSTDANVSKSSTRIKKSNTSTAATTTSAVSKKQSNKTSSSNAYFDELLGINGDFFGNNTRYFTWKVWRKKATILNKLEKALIIDGDYIRLQPPEDKAYLKNPDDNPFLPSQSNSHHHRHLHHYNYSNYYNSTMMKTSSFHITQIVKLKQYKNSKNPNHFKIVIQKPGKDSTNVKKKYDLEAVNEAECEEIIEKIKWISNIYNSEMGQMNH